MSHAIPDNVSFIVCDTETTDATENRRACEIGWVRIDQSFNILEQVEAVLDPEAYIDPSASGVHGLTNIMCEDSPTIEEFFTLQGVQGCHGRLIPGPAVLIGHKISFDRPMIEPYIEHGVAVELCTLRWVKRLYPFASDHKLTTLLYSLNLRTPEGPMAMEARQRYDGGHRVLGDILVALELCRHICERTGMSLLELARASVPDFYVDIMPLGKHKGEPVAEVPKSYIRWMRDNMDMDRDLQYTVDCLLNNKKKNNE